MSSSMERRVGGGGGGHGDGGGGGGGGISMASNRWTVANNHYPCRIMMQVNPRTEHSFHLFYILFFHMNDIVNHDLRLFTSFFVSQVLNLLSV